MNIQSTITLWSRIFAHSYRSKNWMFSVTPEGATASANLYSLIETAKANQIEPYEYLKKLFEKLPLAETVNFWIFCLSR